MRAMGSLHDSHIACCDRERRNGAFPSAEVGRLESRLSHRWFMGRENLQNLDANRSHEPGRSTFVCVAAQRDRTVL